MGTVSTKKTGKNRKYGRNKRAVDQKMSAFVRGKISFEEYNKSAKKAD